MLIQRKYERTISRRTARPTWNASFQAPLAEYSRIGNTHVLWMAALVRARPRGCDAATDRFCADIHPNHAWRQSDTHIDVHPYRRCCNRQTSPHDPSHTNADADQRSAADGLRPDHA